MVEFIEYKEMKKKPTPELQKLLSQYREELRSKRFRVAANQLKQVHELGKLKQNIARIMFLLGRKVEA